MAVIRGFRDLDVYVLAREQAKNIFRPFEKFSQRRKILADGSNTPIVSGSKCHDRRSMGSTQISGCIHQ